MCESGHSKNDPSSVRSDFSVAKLSLKLAALNTNFILFPDISTRITKIEVHHQTMYCKSLVIKIRV